MTAPRVLVVDDEAGLRVTLAANLELEGFAVEEAESGEAALAMATARRYDLVITDIRMPGMDGVELFRALRRQGQQVPVVLMTGFAMEDLVRSALEEGAYTVLSKPFDVPHAVATVSSAARLPVVLVVDDATEVAATTTEALREAGVRAAGVGSAEEAVTLMNSAPVDLCVIDLVMPDVSGPELARQLKALDPKVMVIAVSGHDVPELVRAVVSAGAYTFLQKPFRVRDLIRTIALARGEPPALRRVGS